MGLHEFEHDALTLPINDRAHLAHSLLMSLENLPDEEVDRLWLEEVIRRDNDIDAGIAKLIPADEVFKRLKEQFC
jgi:putative addiction module component (TIGR02574 family)